MKRSIGNDGQSASAPNARNPAFLVGFKVFSKGATAGPGTNPDTVVYVPSPHVLNPFVSDDVRNSYGFVAGDSAFIVTITREFMLANLGHTGDHGRNRGVASQELVRTISVRLLLIPPKVRTTLRWK